MSNLPTENRSNENSDDSLEELEQELVQVNPKIFHGVNKRKKTEILKSVSVTMMHSGPLPDPQSLSAYDQLIPNGADRIMKMAEKQQDHRMKIERTAIGRQTFQSFIGQVFGFLIGLTGIGSGTFLAYNGFTTVGAVIAGGTVVSLVSVFVIGRRSRK
jgi:uncharacterized membrane protein